MISAVVGVTAAVVILTTVDVPGAPVVAKYSAVAAVTTDVVVLPAHVVSNISSVSALVGVPTVEHPFL